MQTYCLSYKKHTSDMGPKKVIMTNKVIRKASKCANYVAESRFLKQKSNKRKWNNVLIIKMCCMHQ